MTTKRPPLAILVVEANDRDRYGDSLFDDVVNAAERRLAVAHLPHIYAGPRRVVVIRDDEARATLRTALDAHTRPGRVFGILSAMIRDRRRPA